MTSETATAPISYRELLDRLRAAVEAVTARDREERRKRVRSAFGLKSDAPVPDDVLTAGRLPSYQITVQTQEYLAMQIRAAVAPILVEYLADADVSAIILGKGGTP